MCLSLVGRCLVSPSLTFSLASSDSRASFLSIFKGEVEEQSKSKSKGKSKGRGKGKGKGKGKSKGKAKAKKKKRKNGCENVVESRRVEP
jgi:hypothetical protein